MWRGILMRARGDFISSNKEGPAWVALTCPPNRTIVNFSQYQVYQPIIMTCLPIAPSLFQIIWLLDGCTFGLQRLAGCGGLGAGRRLQCLWNGSIRSS